MYVLMCIYIYDILCIYRDNHVYIYIHIHIHIHTHTNIDIVMSYMDTKYQPLEMDHGKVMDVSWLVY